MKKKMVLYVVLALIILLVGFFLGQEYTKYKVRKTIQDAFGGIEDVFSDNTNESESSTKTIKEKDREDVKNEIFDDSFELKKGTTETIKGTYEGKELEVQFSLSDVVFINEILPPEPTASYYTYFPEQDGKVYAVAYLAVKNLGGTSFDINYVLKNLYGSSCTSKAVFGGKYEYTIDVVAEIEKDNKGKFDYETSFVYLDPLETKNIIVAYSVPNEVKDMDADLNICLGDKKIVLEFSEEVEIQDNQTESD